MIELVSIIAIVFGILQIVLFFKIWGMTNDVKNILNVLNSKDNRDAKLPSKAIVKGVEGEVAVLKMLNGKVLCRREYGSGWNDNLYDISQLEFVDDKK